MEMLTRFLNHATRSLAAELKRAEGGGGGEGDETGAADGVGD